MGFAVSLPYHLRIEGDPSTAWNWAGWAEKKLWQLQLHLEQIGQGRTLFRQFRPTSNVIVEIHITSGLGRIRIVGAGVATGLYMETGLFDHRNGAPFALESYLPPDYIQGLTIQVQIAGNPLTSLIGEAFLDEALTTPEPTLEGDSQALNIPDSFKVSFFTATDRAGNSQELGSLDGPAIYMPPPVPYQQKLCQAQIPAGEFSGKLQLYVQALYGSKRTDYNIFWPPDSRWWFYIADEDGERFYFDWVHNFNSAIYTDADGEYWTLTIAYGNVTMRPLRPTGKGVALHTRYKVDPPANVEDKRRWEAYIFSTCVVAGREEELIVPGVDSEYVVLDIIDLPGRPQFYGWNFNWQGDKAMIVPMHEHPTRNDILTPDYVWQSYLFDFELTDVGSDAPTLQDRFQFAVTKREGPIDFMVACHGGDNFCGPIQGSSQMRKFVPTTALGIGAIHMGADQAPYYAYYARDGITSVEDEVLLYFNAQIDPDPGSVGLDFSDHPRFQCDNTDPGPPGYGVTRNVTTVSRDWGSLTTRTWTLKRGGVEAAVYETTTGSSVRWKISERTAQAGAASGTWLSWSPNDVKTLCAGTFQFPGNRATDLGKHPDTGAPPSNWWARYQYGPVAFHNYTVLQNSKSGLFAFVIPRGNRQGLYCAQQRLQVFTMAYSWTTNGNFNNAVELMGDWDTVDGQPGPISFRTLSSNIPRFTGDGVSQHDVQENVSNVPQNPTSVVGSDSDPTTLNYMNVDFMARTGGLIRNLFVSYEYENTVDGPKPWPEEESGVGVDLPSAETGGPVFEDNGWEDFTAAIGVGTFAILEVPSNLKAEESVGGKKLLYDDPPLVGAGTEVNDDGYPEDVIWRSLVGHV